MMESITFTQGVVILAAAVYVPLILWALFEWSRVGRYERDVKHILEQHECPLYSLDSCLNSRRSGMAPYDAAMTIMAQWNGYCDSEAHHG